MPNCADIAQHIHSYAWCLEQIKALKEENERLHLDPDERASYNEALAMAEMYRNRLRVKFSKIMDLIKLQKQDKGLWFEARTCPESYLQQELRRLHAVIEE